MNRQLSTTAACHVTGVPAIPDSFSIRSIRWLGLALVFAVLTLALSVTSCLQDSGSGGSDDDDVEYREAILIDEEPIVLAEGSTIEVGLSFRSSRPDIFFTGHSVYRAPDVLASSISTDRETPVTPYLADLTIDALEGSAGMHTLTLQAGDLGNEIERDVTVIVVPRNLAFLPGAVAVAGGDYHSLAILEGGSVWAWGRNDHGQLGDGTTVDRPYPVRVQGLRGPARAVSGGGAHSVALLEDGTVWSWGANDYLQLGAAGELDGRDSPTPVPLACRDFRCQDGLPRFTAIAAGGEHSLALAEGGVIWSWGKLLRGQVGRERLERRDGIPFPIGFPSDLSGVVNFVAIAAGDEFSLALEDDGQVWGWGDNRQNPLGDDFASEYEFPQELLGWGRATAIAAGSSHAVALLEDGTVRVAGGNTFGQLGVPEKTGPLAVRVPNLFDVVAIDAGFAHTVALRADGTAVSWGNNGFDQLGFPEVAPPSFEAHPVLVQAVPPLRAIACGGRHSLAVARDCPQVWSWGDNVVGQLGSGSSQRNGFPVRTLAIGDRDTGNGEATCGVPLSVTVSGSGSVSASEGDIACPDGRCSDVYERNTTVELAAVADEGWVFVGWAGDVVDDDPVTRVLLADSRNVVARFARWMLPPAPAFTFTPDEPVVEETVRFDASSSLDPDGTILRYEWDTRGPFGVTGAGARRDHDFVFPGTYVVELTVTDDQGLVASTTRSVTVAPRPIDDTGDTAGDEGDGTAPPEDTFLLEIEFAGGGTGRVTLAGGELECTGSCSFRLRAGETYRIAATPAEGAYFSHFDGCDGLEGEPVRNVCAVTLDSDRRVTVFFE